MFETETIKLFNFIKKEGSENKGKWEHSPVEKGKIQRFEKYFNEKNLINFRRNSLGGGSLTFPDRPMGYFRYYDGIEMKMPFAQKARGYVDIIREMFMLKKALDFRIPDLNDDLIGNPYHYKFGKTNITDSAIRMFFYSKYIEKEIGKVDKVLEIGGGAIGGVSGRLESKTCVSVELPEVFCLSYWYLRNKGFDVFPIISEKDCKKLNLKHEKKTFFLIVPWLLNRVNFNFDLVINTMSFQHMTKENINYYFDEINKLKAKNLFLVNRNRVADPTDVIMDNYPISPDYFLAKEDKYPFSNHLVRIYKLKK